MRFEVELKLDNVNQIINNLGFQENGPVNERFRDIADKFMDPYIPFETGILKNNKRYPDKSSILYATPYAHYHYKGKKAIGPSRPKGIRRTISNEDMRYQGAPKRGPEWDKRMMNDKEQEVLKELQNFVDNGGK